MEGDLNISGNGRRLQFFRKRKVISISGYGRGPQLTGYERGPQFLMEWKTTYGTGKQLKFSENGSPPQFNISIRF
jgi:hypothetical protein